MKAKLHTLSVSRKFYDNLLTRVDEIIKTVVHDPEPVYFRQIRRLIDNYLNDNLDSIPRSEIYSEIYIIFISLKAEIDRARLRSHKARLAAGKRAPRRADSKNRMNSEIREEALTDSPVQSVSPQTAPVPVKSTPAIERKKRTGLKWKPSATNRKGRKSTLLPHPGIRIISR